MPCPQQMGSLANGAHSPTAIDPCPTAKTIVREKTNAGGSRPDSRKKSSAWSCNAVTRHAAVLGPTARRPDTNPTTSAPGAGNVDGYARSASKDYASSEAAEGDGGENSPPVKEETPSGNLLSEGAARDNCEKIAVENVSKEKVDCGRNSNHRERHEARGEADHGVHFLMNKV